MSGDMAAQPPSAVAYIHFIAACHYLMPVLWPAVVPAPSRDSIGMGKRNGELHGQNRQGSAGMTSSSLINPSRRAEPTHCGLYSFPLSFSFRKRPSRAQKVNVKKRKRTPLCWGLSDPNNGLAHFL